MKFSLKHKLLKFFFRFTRRLRFKFLLFLSIVLAIIFLASTFTVETYISDKFKKENNGRITILLDSLSRNSTTFLIEGSAGELGLDTLVHDIVKDQPDIEYAYIENASHTIVAHSKLEWRGKSSDEFGSTYSMRGIYERTHPIVFFEQEIGVAHIGFNDKSVKEVVQNTRFLMALVMGSALVIAMVGIYWLTSYILTPIYELIEGVILIRRGDFTYKVVDIGKDEIGVLARLFNDMTSDLMTKKILMQALSSYTSEEVTQRIMAGNMPIDTHGQKREATIVFVDIRGFTSLTMTREAYFVVDILNGYFDIIANVSKAHGGFVDKYIGDGAMVTFNTLADKPDHKIAACRFALDLQVELVAYFNRIQEGRRRLHFGIGIASGEIITGNIGSSTKLDFTAIGDAVNKASRLEGLAKNNEAIISDDIYHGMESELIVQVLEPVFMKGFQNQIPLYSLEGIKKQELHPPSDTNGQDKQEK